MEKEKLHIAFVSNTSWSIYNFRLGVIKSFLNAGHTVYAVAPRDAYTEKLIANKVKFINIPLNNYSTNPLKDLKLIFELIRIYSRHKFDRVFHYTIKPNIYGSLAASVTGLPSISITTGLGKTFSFKNWFVQKSILQLYKISLSKVDEIWTLNQSNYNTLITAGLTTKEKSYLLPSEGINTQKFRPSKKKRDNKIFRFLFAGRLLKDKGIFEYIEAARVIKRYHSNVKIEVLGFLDSNNKNAVQLEELSKWQDEGIINYLGSTEDVRPYIDRADCVVLPSYYQEGVSRILLEAASMATPIITTDHVGCRDVVVNDYNGYLVSPHDISALVQKMGYMLQLSYSRLMSLGTNGRDLVKSKYDERIIIEIYQQVLNGNAIKERISKNLISELSSPINNNDA